VTRLPALSRPTFDIDGSSAEVDARVRAKVRAGEPLYQVDEVALTALDPDVVITQTHCEVCAVGPDALGSGPRRRQRVATFRGGSLEGVLADFQGVAAAIGRPDAGAELVGRLRAEMDGWRRRTEGLARPRVLCLEWIDPPFSMGNWGPELVELAGGESLLAHAGQHSRALSWQAVREVDPDVLVVAPCGWALTRTVPEMESVAARPGFSDLLSARQGRVYAADGNLYFNRSSPSLFATIERLAEMIHPDRFGTEHEGRDYLRYPPGRSRTAP
jgi:iron complex transport system substrate-binding protein